MIICWQLNLAPSWFLTGGLVAISLGIFDDNFDIPWFIKLIIQVFLSIYIASVFWGDFTSITFYNYVIEINKPLLFTIFLIWFIGIFNSVNLIDGVDGLAGGFMILILHSSFFISENSFLFICLYLILILFSFLILNQRPAKIFMGDSGSLFLGYFLAVLPLLYMDLGAFESDSLNITPFLILSSFLIADTSRVFLTRILSGKNPMNADTIHFHHLVLQNSGSYIATLSIIFFITLVSSLFASSYSYFSYNEFLIFHLAFIFTFILLPPAPTYINRISLIVKPLYSWNKPIKDSEVINKEKTILVLVLSLSLIFIIFFQNFNKLIYQHIIAFSLLLSYLFLIKKNLNIKFSFLKCFVCILILEIGWLAELSVISKTLSVFILVSIFIFTLQRRRGTAIKNNSALDIIIFLIGLGSLIINFIGISINIWLLIAVLSIWISISFILRRLFLS